MAAQICHAAGESVKEQVLSGTHAVILSVDNEAIIREISLRLKDASVEHVVIEESDEPYAGQVMSIGLVPILDRTKAKKILSSLPLLR